MTSNVVQNFICPESSDTAKLSCVGPDAITKELILDECEGGSDFRRRLDKQVRSGVTSRQNLRLYETSPPGGVTEQSIAASGQVYSVALRPATFEALSWFLDQVIGLDGSIAF